MIKRKCGPTPYSDKGRRLVQRELALAVKHRRERKEHLLKLVEEVKNEMRAHQEDT